MISLHGVNFMVRLLAAVAAKAAACCASMTQGTLLLSRVLKNPRSQFLGPQHQRIQSAAVWRVVCSGSSSEGSNALVRVRLALECGCSLSHSRIPRGFSAEQF